MKDDEKMHKELFELVESIYRSAQEKVRKYIAVERRILSGTNDGKFSGSFGSLATRFQRNDIGVAAPATRCLSLFKAAA